MTSFDSAGTSSLLEKIKIPHQLNVSLKKHTTFLIGGSAAILAHPQNIQQLQDLQKFVLDHNIPFFLLGGGSNLLVSDEGFPGIVVHPQFDQDYTSEEKNAEVTQFRIAASARAPATARKISRAGFRGFEFLTTIPGEIGGAIIQNAGCYGHEIRDSIDEVIVVENGEVKSYSREQSQFGYRSSYFKGNNSVWIAEGIFSLPKGNLSEIEETMRDYQNRRVASQPRNRRSAGSIFKNPEDNSAWKLIDDAGLRGFASGGAKFSEKHSNFIVNTGTAKASDVYHLILEAKKRVKDNTGIILETEIVLLGNFSGREETP